MTRDATDHFSELWGIDSAPVEHRALALRYFEAGRVFAQAEIQQKAIAEAERIDNLPDDSFEISQYDEHASLVTDALRAFAAGLIRLKREG